MTFGGSVNLTSGSQTATFTVHTKKVTQPTSATITASYAGKSVTTTLTLTRR